MEVSENGGTPISSILMGFSLLNHPFGDTSICGRPLKSVDVGDLPAISHSLLAITHGELETPLKK